jgi:hypothetical protein
VRLGVLGQQGRSDVVDEIDVEHRRGVRLVGLDEFQAVVAMAVFRRVRRGDRDALVDGVVGGEVLVDLLDKLGTHPPVHRARNELHAHPPAAAHKSPQFRKGVESC